MQFLYTRTKPFFLHRLLWLTILTISTVQGIAQDPLKYVLDHNSKLPSNEVYNVVQDDFGYIWIGCDAGLYRYDGFVYKSYPSKTPNGNSISFLKKDSNNRIWCKNFFGQIYKVEGDSLKIVYETTTSNPSLPLFSVDNSSQLWVVTNDGILGIAESGQVLQEIKTSELNLSGSIVSIVAHENEIFIFDANFNICRLDLTNYTITSVPSKSGFSGIYNLIYASSTESLEFVLESKDSEVKYHYLRFDPISRTFNEIGNLDWLNNIRLFSVRHHNNSILLTTSNGVYVCNPDLKIKHRLFANEKISSSLQDHEGQLWLSTLENGIYVVPDENITRNAINLPESKESEHISQMYSLDQSNEILLGSYSGKLISYDMGSKQSTEIYPNAKETFINVKKIYRSGKYLLVSRGRLTIIDLETATAYYPKLSNIRDFAIKDDTCYAVFPDFVIKTALSVLLSSGSLEYEIINDEGGKSLVYDSISDRMYFSLGSGTYELSSEGKWQELRIEERSIFANELFLNEGKLWIATATDGILCFENNQMVDRFNASYLMNERNVKHLFMKDQLLWATTKSHLHKINLITKEQTTFGSSQGIISNDINDLLIHDGKLLLATQQGLLSLPESLDIINSTPPKIKLDQIILNEKILPITPSVTLPFENSLKIVLSSIALKSRGNYTYEYQLIGIDKTPVVLPASTPFIQFSRIPSGNYLLRIRAINEAGIASEEIELNITVSSVFWQAWWFYLLLSLLIIGVMAVVFIWRIRYVRQKAHAKNLLVSSQLIALKAQMNPHFMFNTLNSLQDLILKQDFKNTNYFLSKYATLMRMILHNSEKQYISLEEEIKMLDIYLQLEKLRFGEDFTFTLQIDSDSNLTKEIPSMMLQPFVENAIKHGLLHKKGEKKLAVSFSFDKAFVMCTIIDNGIGRDRSAEINKRQQSDHQSFSTDANLKRAALLSVHHNSDFKIAIEDLFQDNESAGTKVTLYIPCK